MRPLILITNDDGVNSPGIRAVAEAVMDLADILIVAPLTQQTGMGRSFPRGAEMGRIEPVTIKTGSGDITAYGITGSPASAVAHGVLELADRKPDLCISGVNYGENMGMILTCSGTVGAALEAVSHGIPALAVSAQFEYQGQHASEYPENNWDNAKKATRYWTEKVLEQGFPEGIDIFNINTPLTEVAAEDYRITRLAPQSCYVLQKPEKRDFAAPYQLQFKVQMDEDSLAKDSDIYVLYKEQKISVTPLSWDMSRRLPAQWGVSG